MTDAPRIALFDMDHTLIGEDADVSWKRFLVDEGLAPAEEIAEADRYWRLYAQSALPVEEFLAFQFRQFVGRTPEEMRALARRHFEARLAASVHAEAREAVQAARAEGASVAIVTATNAVLAEPVAAHFAMDALMATDPELTDGRYTGGLAGAYCYREAKIDRARAFCAEHGADLREAVYYGDSANDIPLLEAVGRAVAVNPGPDLESHARSKGWEILRWGA